MDSFAAFLGFTLLRAVSRSLTWVPQLSNGSWHYGCTPAYWKGELIESCYEREAENVRRSRSPCFGHYNSVRMLPREHSQEQVAPGTDRCREVPEAFSALVCRDSALLVISSVPL